MSIRIAFPLVASTLLLAACEMPTQSSSSVSFGMSSSAIIPAGVPCERIDERYRDQVDGCELVVSSSSQKQMTRADLIDLNVKFSSEVTNFVNFDFDKSVLRPDARATLDQQAAWIAQYSDLHFSVFGHTDLVGSADYNFGLAKRRADAVVAYLISKGVSEEQLESVVSFGKTQPLIQTTRREEANRRAITEVSGYLNTKRVSRGPISCSALGSAYAASYPVCIDRINVPPTLVPPEPEVPGEPEPEVTVVEAEYGNDSNVDPSDRRGRASITDDGQGNRIAEASGETGPVEDPRTTTFARSETSTDPEQSPGSLSAAATGRAGAVGVGMDLNPDGTPDYSSVRFGN